MQHLLHHNLLQHGTNGPSIVPSMKEKDGRLGHDYGSMGSATPGKALCTYLRTQSSRVTITGSTKGNSTFSVEAYFGHIQQCNLVSYNQKASELKGEFREVDVIAIDD